MIKKTFKKVIELRWFINAVIALINIMVALIGGTRVSEFVFWIFVAQLGFIIMEALFDKEF